MGIGIADQLPQAMEKAISCPLLDNGALESAQRIILNINPSEQTSISEIHVALDVLEKRLSEHADIIGGLTGIKDQPMITLYVSCPKG